MTTHMFIGQGLIKFLPLIIDSAEKSLRLAMYQISAPTAATHTRQKDLWHCLEAAALRGIKCTAILSQGSGFLPGSAAVQQSAQRLANAGWSVRLAPDSKLMHAKVLIVDDSYLITGSHNWTAAGLLMNHEMSIGVQDGLLADAARVWHQSLFERLGK